MSVINKQSLRKIISRSGYKRRIIIRREFSNREGKFSAWGSGSIQDIHEAVAGFLPRNAGPDYGDDVRECEDRFQDQGADTVDYDDRFRVYSSDSSDKCVATMPWIKVVSVPNITFDLLSVRYNTEVREETYGDVTFS
jgi:hypothetical protein